MRAAPDRPVSQPTPETPPTEIKRPRGIYLLPNLFTTAALFAGFYGVLAAMNGRYEAAAVAIFVAMILDGLDGRVARMTHTESEFGVQYDSLSDMVSFGVAPGLIMYQWTLSGLGKAGWLAAFVYTAGAALRLARFNVQVGSIDKRYFMGLPSPSAAAVTMGLVWIGTDLGLDPARLELPAFVLTLGAGLLMVSNFLFHSFKKIDLNGKVPFVVVTVVMLGFGLATLQTPAMVFGGFLIYALSGPTLAVVRWRRRRRRHGADAGSGG
ncbi:CDP-diacylglycerol--serine O-phosphatidyltransferase [Plasticicumulans sp.]|uniref:CDP-diacylglycerol--serine O-phosphatidyltransferase n=1 Tax=Plasticicumulans sp. TaxID=2307179 RepID=UPI00396479D6|nr:CDP-diacylglycerol--serine O-phosphatidyltransferase [Pseudomonadota bacterium]